MTRILLLLVMIAIGGIATVIYFYATDTTVVQVDAPAADSGQHHAVATTIDVVETTPRPTAEPPAYSDNEKAAPAITVKQIEQWIAETADEDPAVRATAIDALASAPKSKAFPALLHVMRSGIDADRQLALDSLHTLALQQGDEDDGIRTALRLVIYDGDEETLISGAQIALEDIEYGLNPDMPKLKPSRH